MEKKEQFCIFECGKYSNPFSQPFMGSHECIDKYRIREENLVAKASSPCEAMHHSHHHHNNEDIMSPSRNFDNEFDKCSLDQMSERAFQEQLNSNVPLSDKEYQIQLKEVAGDTPDFGELFDPLDFYCDSEKEEEALGNNTKPCLTNKDFQSIPDLQAQIEPDLPPISIIKIQQKKEAVPALLRITNHSMPSIKEERKDEVFPSQDRTLFLKLPEENTDMNPTISFKKDTLPDNIPLEIATKPQNSQEEEKNSFEWNNFLVRRACFRGLSEFYKKKFSKINISWQRKRVNKKKKTPMHELIKQFATNEFGNMIDNLSEEQWRDFRNTLYSVLFSHRYKKTDDFLEGVDFSIIRGVLYSYTTELRVELLTNPFFSIMMLKFLEKGKSSFLREKLKGKPALY